LASDFIAPESNPRPLSGEEDGLEIWIGASPETFLPDGAAGGVGFQNIETDMGDNREPEGRGVFSGSATASPSDWRLGTAQSGFAGRLTTASRS